MIRFHACCVAKTISRHWSTGLTHVRVVVSLQERLSEVTLTESRGAVDDKVLNDQRPSWDMSEAHLNHLCDIVFVNCYLQSN